MHMYCKHTSESRDQFTVEEYHTDRHYKWKECTGDRHYKWEECTDIIHTKPVYCTGVY